MFTCYDTLLCVCVPVKVQKSDHPHSWDPCVNYCHPANSTLCNTSSTLNKSWTASNNNTINSLDYCKCKNTNRDGDQTSSSVCRMLFLRCNLLLQLWYLPVSLPALRLHQDPAARAPVPCPGLQFPWVHVTHSSNEGRGRKSTKAPVSSTSARLSVQTWSDLSKEKLVMFVCVFSVSRVQFGWSGWSSSSCGDQWGRPDRRPTQRLRRPAAGRNIRHRNTVRTPAYPIYWAWQLSREVSTHTRSNRNKLPLTSLLFLLQMCLWCTAFQYKSIKQR